MGLGGMPRKKKDDIDWDNLEGEASAVPSRGAGAARRRSFLRPREWRRSIKSVTAGRKVQWKGAIGTHGFTAGERDYDPLSPRCTPHALFLTVLPFWKKGLSDT